MVKKQSFKLGIRKATPLKSNKDNGPALVKEAYRLLGDSDPTVYFPPKSALTARFDNDSKCYGKVSFVPCNIFTEGRLCTITDGGARAAITAELKAKDPEFEGQLKRELVAGKYNNGGSVTFVMDMAGIKVFVLPNLPLWCMRRCKP